MDKSHINIYEPIWIATPEDPMKYQLVISKLADNEVSGYVSERAAGVGKSAETARILKPDHPRGE